jgi:hypothetical protein
MLNHLIQPAPCEGELIELRISRKTQIAKANLAKSADLQELAAITE